MSSARVVLLLFVINLGVAFGAGLYESVIVVPRWLVVGANGVLHWNSEAAIADGTGQRFWIWVSTVPLTLLAAWNLWIAMRRTEGTLRHWWMTAAGLSLAERAMTFLYFIPVMVGLMGTIDTPEAVADAHRWVNLNYVRHALVLGAWLAALRTFGLVQRAKRRPQAYYEAGA